MPETKPNASDSFEEALTQLETAVSRLEAGDLKLEEALEIFEKGIAASRQCNHWLDQSRKRVQTLVAENDGNLRLGFLDEEEDDNQSTQ